MQTHNIGDSQEYSAFSAAKQWLTGRGWLCTFRAAAPLRQSMIAESQIHEGRQFVENPEEARSPLPGCEAARAYLRHQQA